MRSPRLKLHDCSAVYHCVSRIAGGQYLLGDLEKEQFRRQTWLLADFCGVEALGYSVMSDHFHLAIRVPAPGPVSDEEIARRLRVLYPKRHPDVRAVEADLKLRGRIDPKLRKRLLQRMGDISMYLKELKQRFTRWYNRQHDRYGTMWAERFKSVLVEDQPEAILTLLKYIDLNAVRAGLMVDPKDYRFCSYTEALSVGGKARQGLAGCLPGKNWAEQSQYYRQALLIQSGVSGHSDKRALSREQIRAKLGKEGVLPLNVLLRLRVRYLTDGAVLGSRAFVDKVFRRFRHHFGKRRKDGARRMKGADWGGLMVLRSLQRDVFG